MAYTYGNKDDINMAIKALDIFTHNWCMNCEKTEKSDEYVFRCDECEFSGRVTCLVKKFVESHANDPKILENFGTNVFQ